MGIESIGVSKIGGRAGEAQTLRSKTVEPLTSHEYISPFTKPIVSIQTPHGPFSAHNIDLMDSAVRAQLEETQGQHPHKVVAVVLENSGCSRDFAARFRARTSDTESPLPPTEAFVATFVEHTFPEGLPAELKHERVREEVLKITNPYSKTQLEKLDAVAADHPNRLKVVFEAHDKEVIDMVNDPINDTAFAILETYVGDRAENMKDEDFAAYRAAASRVAAVASVRDTDNTNTVLDLIEDNSVVGVVYPEGSVHRTGDILKSMGLLVDLQTEDGPFGNLPVSGLVRKIMAKPEIPVTDEDIRQTIAAQNAALNIKSGDSNERILAKKQAWLQGKYVHEIDYI
jgi:hypothetical protein